MTPKPETLVDRVWQDEHQYQERRQVENIPRQVGKTDAAAKVAKDEVRAAREALESAGLMLPGPWKVEAQEKRTQRGRARAKAARKSRKKNRR